ncbi:MAG TPA: hypothetical protein VK988_08450 [Acidimicrobiales bacterium]|nr:hypothetical protein [Acidimicrobiales bacterium]
MDLEAALAYADQDLRETVTEMERLRERFEALQVERQGLALALARHSGVVAPEKAPDQSENEWLALPRTEAIIRVLRRANEALSPVEVTRQLSEVGRRDHASAVSAALSYLRRKGEVESLGRGQWVLTAPPLKPFDSEAAELDSWLRETNSEVHLNGSGSHSEKQLATINLAAQEVATDSPDG